MRKTKSETALEEQQKASAIRYIEGSLECKLTWAKKEEAGAALDIECGITTTPNNAKALGVVVARLEEVLLVLRRS